jgi:hypothetical protein
MTNPLPFPQRGSAALASPVGFQPFSPVTTERPTFPRPDFAVERIAMARADLREAERTDLHSADDGDLIHLVERLRGALADMIRLSGCAPRKQLDELDWSESVDLVQASHAQLGELVNRLCGSLAVMIFVCSTGTT